MLQKRESENHRMGWLGRDPSGSWSPNSWPCPDTPKSHPVPESIAWMLLRSDRLGAVTPFTWGASSVPHTPLGKDFFLISHLNLPQLSFLPFPRVLKYVYVYIFIYIDIYIYVYINPKITVHFETTCTGFGRFFFNVVKKKSLITSTVRDPYRPFSIYFDDATLVGTIGKFKYLVSKSWNAVNAKLN